MLVVCKTVYWGSD